MAAFQLGMSRLTCNGRHIVQQVNVKPTDVLGITIHINYLSLYDQSNTFHCYTFPYIPFKSFYNQVEGQDYLNTYLSCCEGFSTVDFLEVAVPNILSSSQRFLKLDQDSGKPYDSEPQPPPRVYHMDLVAEIIEHTLDEREEQEMDEVIEESMQEIRMTPASERAIQELLKKPEIVKKDESCVICMQEFGVDEEEEAKDLCAMPCDHIFHRICILHWLEMNHKCPLCRYALPTVNNEETN